MKVTRRLLEVTFAIVDELLAEQQFLLRVAFQARKNAQAPYSNYLVGAAVRSKQGNIYPGCNVERCTYSETTHAEQSAIDAMICSEGEGAKIHSIAVVAAPRGSEMVWPPTAASLLDDSLDPGCPCGRCLQTIWENCGGDPSVEILDMGADSVVSVGTIGNLFPFRFGPQDLGIVY